MGGRKGGREERERDGKESGTKWLFMKSSNRIEEVIKTPLNQEVQK